MNDIERKMVEIARGLKEYGLCGARASFEDEGINQIQLSRLKEIAACADLPLFLKIGGCENLTGVYDALTVGVEEMVAPMVESKFALKKFLEMVHKEIAEDNQKSMAFGFNLETITGVHQFDSMLDMLASLNPSPPKLLVNVGRVDLARSLGLSREDINTSQQMFGICEEVFIKSREAGLKTSLGGGINVDALPIILHLNKSDLLDRFETRRLVFEASAERFGDSVIREAVKFELLYLYSLQRFGSRIQARDKTRITMIESRLDEDGRGLASWAKSIVAKVTK